MNSKATVKAISAPKAVFDMALEIGDGNLSKGFRKAVENYYGEWQKEQAKKWLERTQAVKHER